MKINLRKITAIIFIINMLTTILNLKKIDFKSYFEGALMLLLLIIIIYAPSKLKITKTNEEKKNDKN